MERNQRALTGAAESRVTGAKRQLDSQARELKSLANSGLISKREMKSALSKLDKIRTNLSSLLSDSKKISKKKSSKSGQPKKQSVSQTKQKVGKARPKQGKVSVPPKSKRKKSSTKSGAKKSPPKKVPPKKQKKAASKGKAQKVAAGKKRVVVSKPKKSRTKKQGNQSAREEKPKKRRAYKVPPEFIDKRRHNYPIVPLTGKESKQIFDAFLLEDEAMKQRLREMDEQLLQPGQVWGYKVGNHFVSMRTFRSLERFSDYMGGYITQGKLTKNSFDVFALVKYGASQAGKGYTDLQLGEFRQKASEQITKQAERNVKKSRAKAKKKKEEKTKLKKQARKLPGLEKRLSKSEERRKKLEEENKLLKKQLRDAKKKKG